MLLERLGDGGMGEVYRAHDPQLGRVVAVKVVRGATEERRRRFVREQQAAARVRHHGVVAVHDAGEADGLGWLAMDLVEGESLEAVLRRGPLEPRAALRLVLTCARAVEALHAAGVLHRDLKPGNILLDREGNPRLTDFGVAALEGAEALTRTGQLVGTPLYMAPEQLTGKAVDRRADVYGLGAVLYEALAGRPAWTADTFHELLLAKADRPPPASGVRRGASGGTSSLSSGTRPGPVELSADAVLLRALSPDPGERQPDAGALADELERALAPASAGPSRRLALALAAAIACGAALVLAVRLRGEAPAAAPPRTPAELRRSVESRLLHASRLLGPEPELVALLRAVPEGGDDRSEDAAALRAWAGLVALAEGDPTRAAALDRDEGARGPALALRGGLRAHAGDAAQALQELDGAGRAGLRHAELDGWRARAQARRGVERADASRLLERVAALRAPGAGPTERAGADLLEVACLVGMGKRDDASDALERLAAPPGELRWDLAVLAASAAVDLGRHVEARDGTAGRPGPSRVPRPARPILAREVELAARLEAYLRRCAAPGTILNDPGRQQLSAALELRALLAPERSGPADLATALLNLVRRSVIAGESAGMLALLLGISEVWGDDGPLQGEVIDDVLALRFLDGGYLLPPGPDEPRLAALGQRATRAARPLSVARLEAGAVHAATLLQLGRLDEVARAIDEASDVVGAMSGTDADAQRLAGTLLLLRGRLAAARGDTDRALSLLDEARGRVHLQHLTYARLDALRTGRRGAELLEATLGYAREGPDPGNLAVLPLLRQLVWEVLSDAGRWPELSAYYELLLDAPGRGASLSEIARAVVALAEQGRDDLAADRARLLAARPDLPADLVQRLRAGEPSARDAVRRLAQ